MMNATNRSLGRVAWAVILAILWLLASGPMAQGGTIIAVGTADPVAEGIYAGWYKYTYQISWTGGKGEGLSHFDLLLTSGAGQDALFGFDSAAGGSRDGQSTGSAGAGGGFKVDYLAALEPAGDPSLHLATPLIKWEPVAGHDSPGQSGTGLFWFYANLVPDYSGYDGTHLVVAKQGKKATYGDLSGAYPSMTMAVVLETVPEPATLVFVGLGLVLTLAGRRRK